LASALFCRCTLLNVASECSASPEFPDSVASAALAAGGCAGRVVGADKDAGLLGAAVNIEGAVDCGVDCGPDCTADAEDAEAVACAVRERPGIAC
jgi:hypothetical protein